MPPKRAAQKVVQQVQQLKVPSYSSRAQPHPFMSWLRNVDSLNLSRNARLMTVDNIRRAWLDTLKSSHCPDRVVEMETKAAKEEIQRVVDRGNIVRTAHTARSKKMAATKVPMPDDVDVSQ